MSMAHREAPVIHGDPHIFIASGFAGHNSGATYHGTARPPLDFPPAHHGLPTFEHYDPKLAKDAPQCHQFSHPRRVK